jgi:ABC-type Na+ transport system ATPase subunit NatA
VIAQACQEAHYVQTVVAAVSPDLYFRGVDIVMTRELSEHIEQRQEEGWMLLFSAEDTVEDIEQRCQKMETYARLRSEMIQRWMDRQV